MALNMNNGVLNRYVLSLSEKVAILIKNAVFIAGALAILAIDLITGPIYLGGFNTTNNTLMSVIFWCVSLSMTAIQMVYWDYTKKNGGIRRSKAYLPLIGAMTLMAIDTMFDIGFVTQLLYEGTPPSQLVPNSIELVWYMIVIAVGLISLFCEPLLMWCFGRLNNR